VGKRFWRDPASFVPNVSLKQRVSWRQRLIETAGHRIGRIEKIRHSPVIIGTEVIGSREYFAYPFAKFEMRLSGMRFPRKACPVNGFIIVVETDERSPVNSVGFGTIPKRVRP